MEIAKSLLRRLLLVGLFFAAFLTTLQVISGVEIEDILEWYQGGAQPKTLSEHPTQREILTPKSVKAFNNSELRASLK